MALNNRLFRICTEYRNVDKITRLIGEHGFKGATLLQGTGIWEGTTEDSLVIEIVSNSAYAASVGALAAAIKSANHQDAVLVQSIAVESLLV